MQNNFEFMNETLDNSSYISVILGDNIINYQLEMLTNNSIKNLLEAKKIRKNNDIKVSYDVTSKVSLEHILSRGKMSRNKFLLLLKGLVNAYEELPEYQLVGEGILLDRKYIYINPDTNEPYFVYIPLSENEINKKEIKEFFTRFIIDGCIEVSQDNFVQVFLEMINSDNISISSIKNFLARYKNSGGGKKEPIPPKEKPVKEPVIFVPPVNPIPVVPPVSTSDKKNSQEPKVAENKSGKGGIVRFLLVQVGIIVIIAGVISQGLLKGSDGNIKIEMAAGLAILLVVGDILAYKYMVLANKDKGGKNNDSNGITYVKASDIQKNKIPHVKANNIPKNKIPEPPVKPVIKQKQFDMQNSNSHYDNKNIEIYKQNEVYETLPNNSNFDTAIDGSDLTICDDIDEKTELMSGKPSPYLVYVENGMPIKINLEKRSTVIGRKRDSVDYVISSGKVGRVHAEILYHDSKYYIKDCNSKNGSYINNGSRLLSDTEFEIKDGDKIRLADVEMILHIL